MRTQKPAAPAATQSKRKPLVRKAPKPPTAAHSLSLANLPSGETFTRIVPHEFFQHMESVMTEAGIINHVEWFARGGAYVPINGGTVYINPTGFNGATWIVEFTFTAGGIAA